MMRACKVCGETKPLDNFRQAWRDFTSLWTGAVLKILPNLMTRIAAPNPIANARVHQENNETDNETHQPRNE